FCPAAGGQIQFVGCADNTTTSTTTTTTTVCVCHNGELETSGFCVGHEAEYCKSCDESYRLRMDWPETGEHGCHPICEGVTCPTPNLTDSAYYISRLGDTYCIGLSQSEALQEGVFPEASCLAGCCQQGCTKPAADSELEKRVDTAAVNWTQTLASDAMLPPVSSGNAIAFAGAVCDGAQFTGDSPRFFCPAAGGQIQFVGCADDTTTTSTTTTTTTTVCVCHNGELETSGFCVGHEAEYCKSCDEHYRLRMDWPETGEHGCHPICEGVTCPTPNLTDSAYYISRLGDTYCIGLSQSEALQEGVFPEASCLAGCCQQ
ncbi:unnamed protein product, partial [Amoebophrya sp. A120]